MEKLLLHEFHAHAGARFLELNGVEMVADFGEPLAEYSALRFSAGVLDLSGRGRVCLTGSDRARFLHGQVTNDVNRLRMGEGCYAALVTAKGKMVSDLNLYCLTDEILLDLEPGLSKTISQRLEKFIIADDVQVIDVSPHYGLLSVQGPEAVAVVSHLGFGEKLPAKAMTFSRINEPEFGEVYLVNHARLGTSGFDLFVPAATLQSIAEGLIAGAGSVGGRACGWQALETARIEAGIPRFGIDMDESNFPQEAGIEERAINYNKGCYVGQEILNRIHTFGHVSRQLCGLQIAGDLKNLPAKGDKLFYRGKEAGYVTSSSASPAAKANIALGYLRKEAGRPGTELVLRTAAGEGPANVVELPFKPN